MKRCSRIVSSIADLPWMTFHVWGRATLLGLAMLMLAGGNDKQAHLPLPPGEAGIAQPIPRNITRTLEMTGQTVAAKRDDLVARI
jgi:hypothetical protein